MPVARLTRRREPTHRFDYTKFGEAMTSVFLKAVDIVMPAWSADDELLARALRAARPKKKPLT